MEQTISQLILGKRPQTRVLFAEPNHTSSLKRLMNTMRQRSICLSSAPIEEQLIIGSGLCPILLFEYELWFPTPVPANDVADVVNDLVDDDEGVVARIATWFVSLDELEGVMSDFLTGLVPRGGIAVHQDDFGNIIYDVEAGERFKVARFGLAPLPGSRACA